MARSSLRVGLRALRGGAVGGVAAKPVVGREQRARPADHVADGPEPLRIAALNPGDQRIRAFGAQNVGLNLEVLLLDAIAPRFARGVVADGERVEFAEERGIGLDVDVEP